MSHKSLDSFKKQVEEAKTLFYESDKFRDWLYINAIVNVVLFAFLFVLYTLVHNQTVNTVIQIGFAISVFFIFVTLHEVLHGVVAQALGYKCEFKQTPITVIPKLNQVLTTISIDVYHPMNEKWKRDSTLIALAPHLLFHPIALLSLAFGLINGILFLSALGAITLVGHSIALFLDWFAR